MISAQWNDDGMTKVCNEALHLSWPGYKNEQYKVNITQIFFVWRYHIVMPFSTTLGYDKYSIGFYLVISFLFMSELAKLAVINFGILATSYHQPNCCHKCTKYNRTLQFTVKNTFAYDCSWWRHQIRKAVSSLLAVCEGINRSPVDSSHRGQLHGVLMFFFICAWKRLNK